MSVLVIVDGPSLEVICAFVAAVCIVRVKTVSTILYLREGVAADRPHEVKMEKLFTRHRQRNV